MALTRSQKEHIVNEISLIADSSVGMLAAEYSGMSVAEMTALRRLASDADVCVRVVKNTLAKKALENTSYASVHESLKGQLVLAFANQGPGDAAKIFKQYGKQCESLKVQFLSLGGELIRGDQLDMVATLPSRDEAIAQLMGTIQAPIAKFAATLNEVPAKLVRTLSALKDVKSN